MHKMMFNRKRIKLNKKKLCNRFIINFPYNKVFIIDHKVVEKVLLQSLQSIFEFDIQRL